MTDGYTLEWHSMEHGIAEITVRRAGRSHRVRVQMAMGDDTGAEELSTRDLAIRAFKELEAERICRAAAKQSGGP